MLFATLSIDTDLALGELRVGRFRFRSRFHFRIGCYERTEVHA